MAKGEEPGSDKSEIKRMLKIAIGKPVHMAFALGEDGKAILKLDKLKQPRSLEKGLKEDAKGSRNHRFGSVHIDPENPKVVQFIVNKEVGGFARKLVGALKGSGYKKVILLTEDGATLEEHEEEDEEEEGGAGAAATPAATPAAASPAPAPAAPPAAPASGAPDAAGLTKALAGLVKQMMGVIAHDPSQKASLIEMATDAQASLKSGALEQAAAGIDVFRMALADVAPAGGTPAGGTPAAADPAPPAATPAPYTPPPATPPQASPQTLRKSRVAWTATRAKIDAELDKLSTAIAAAGDGEGGDDLTDRFYAAVDPVLATFDDRLSDMLDRAADADGEERTELLAEARDIVGRYASFVSGSPVIKQLDGNPFVPLVVGKTLTATLGTLSKMIT